jgi:hypothetical protein
MSTTVDTTENQDPALIEQVRQAVERDPSLTQQLVTFLTDECPDPVPLERSSDPLFYDSLKNGGELRRPAMHFIQCLAYLFLLLKISDISIRLIASR